MQTTIAEGYIPGCIGRIAQLHAAYYSQHSGFGVEFEAKVAGELAAFCRDFVPGRDGIWLAQGDEIEGSIAIDGSRGREDEGAHLRWFIASDALRGQGVGRELLRRAVEFSDRQGYRRVQLWTFAGLDAARHLYESHGFRLHRQSPGSRWGQVVQEQQFIRETAG